jgi:hypothetical protein
MQSNDCRASLYEQLLKPLYSLRRNSKSLGKIGPCQFESPQTFFPRILNETSNVAPSWDFHFPVAVGIGDIHADFIVLLSVLKMMKVINEHGHFASPRKVLVVFCGDLLDGAGRGCVPELRNVREEVDIIQYLHYLKLEARSQGSEIVTVLGNHDLYRSIGWPSLERYIGQQILGWTEDIPNRSKMQYAQQFFQQILRLYIARNFPIYVRNRDFAFMHTGFPSSFQNLVLPSHLNQVVFELLGKRRTVDDRLIQDIILPWIQAREPMNPIQIKNELLCLPVLRKMQLVFGVSYFVFGHTTQSTFVPFCNSHVFRIDFAMSKAFCEPNRDLSALFVTEGFVYLVRCDQKRRQLKSTRYVLPTRSREPLKR